MPKARDKNFLDVGLEDDHGSHPFDCSRHGPIPSAVILASRVVLGPRLRGTEQHALSPLGDQA